MSVRYFTPAETPDMQTTGATGYYGELERRFATQLAARIPRSRSSWEAEQDRLGSWNTGVGRFSPVGFGQSYVSGRGNPRFDYNPDEDEDANAVRTHP